MKSLIRNFVKGKTRGGIKRALRAKEGSSAAKKTLKSMSRELKIPKKKYKPHPMLPKKTQMLPNKTHMFKKMFKKKTAKKF